MDNLLFSDDFSLYQSANLEGKAIADHFVVRLAEFDTIMSDIRNHPMEGSVQHFLLLGRRGSGKSSLLKRIEYEITTDGTLSPTLIPINLAEEQAGIYRLYDLWEQVIQELKDLGHISQTAEPEADYNDTAAYTRACFEMILHSLVVQHKKIILLLDNIDRIFENIREEASLLREVLLNHKVIRIIGGSTRMSEHFWRYDLPFYQFFRIIRLEALSREEVETLLLHWSKVYQVPALEAFVKEKPGQLASIRLLTDGLPRTLKFFIRIILQRTEADSYQYLRRIMDFVSPLYQERLNSLTSAHRKIILELAAIWEGTGIKPLAAACRMESKLVSAHLKQLTENGITIQIPTSKRNHLYRIEERFFNLWLIFTQGSPANKRRQKYLTLFLENWYDAEDIRRIAHQHLDYLNSDNPHGDFAALQTKILAHSRYISFAEKEDMLEKTLALEDVPSYIREHLPKPLGKEIQNLIYKNNYEEAEKLVNSIEQDDGSRETYLGVISTLQKDNTEAEKYYLEAINKRALGAHNNLAVLYKNMKRIKEAEDHFMEAIKEGNISSMYNLANMYADLDRREEAKEYYLMAKDKGHIRAMYNLALLYYSINQYPGKALSLMDEYNSKLSGDIQAKSFAFSVSLWNGHFENLHDRTKNLLSIENPYRETILKELLIHHQKQLVLTLMNEDPALKEAYAPLYYAARLLATPQDQDFALTIPPELADTVAGIVAYVRERQAFYYNH